MGRTFARRTVILALALGLAAIPLACAPAPQATTSGTHDGIVVDGTVSVGSESIVVEAHVRNDGSTRVFLEPDQCARVVDVELERTRFRSEGLRWDGTVQALKDLVLDDQRSWDDPDFFAPRRLDDPANRDPGCVQVDHLVSLDPGARTAERWELPFKDSRTLREVGSAAALVSLEVVEAKDPNQLAFTDVWSSNAAEERARQGRVARAEQPLSGLLDRPATSPVVGSSDAELFDRLLDHRDLRAWVEAQPADGWRHAKLQAAIPGAGAAFERLHLEMLAATYERPAEVTADPDGSNATLDLPGPADRLRTFARTPGTLPPGIVALPDSEWTMGDDLAFPDLQLPTGRLVVAEFVADATPLDAPILPGAYAVHATLAREGSDERVAFATVVLAATPTVRWARVQDVAVDGGTTMLLSEEGRETLGRQATEDPDGAERLNRQIFDSTMAHDYLGTEWTLAPGVNLVQVSSGLGDGGYPVYVGYDANGRPTRVVVDFLLLHLGWPGS